MRSWILLMVCISFIFPVSANAQQNLTDYQQQPFECDDSSVPASLFNVGLFFITLLCATIITFVVRIRIFTFIAGVMICFYGVIYMSQCFFPANLLMVCLGAGMCLWGFVR